MRKADETNELISNRNHTKVKQLHELQSVRKRQERGLCLVEGLRFIYRAIECGAHVESVVIAPRLAQNGTASALLRKLKRWGVPVIPVTTEVFHYLSLSGEPQGIAAVVRQRIRRLPRTGKAQMQGRWIALSDVRSLGNLVGTSPHATTDYQSINYPENTILLMGSERKGLSNQDLELCDVTVKIPMVGHIDSLNLAMATTVMLYELFNQSRHLR